MTYIHVDVEVEVRCAAHLHEECLRLRIVLSALYNQQEDDICKLAGKSVLPHFINENYNIATAMSSSRADSVLGHYPGWEYLNIK